MSAKDIFHDVVKAALQREQWIITHDPLRFKFGDVNFQIDLGAERLIAALGQFLSYRIALLEREPNRILYMAVPLETYQTFFQLDFTQKAIEAYQILLIVYDPNNEVLVKWTN
jgi:XisH protein